MWFWYNFASLVQVLFVLSVFISQSKYHGISRKSRKRNQNKSAGAAQLFLKHCFQHLATIFHFNWPEYWSESYGFSSHKQSRIWGAFKSKLAADGAENTFFSFSGRPGGFRPISGSIVRIWFRLASWLRMCILSAQWISLAKSGLNAKNRDANIPLSLYTIGSK